VAQAGRIQFFAAGNQGDSPNTVGGPAIAFFKDPKTGAMTIVSVGATDADLNTAWFQSRGPWSPFVARNQEKFPGYPNRVDIQSIGHKVYGAYPTYMEGADYVDPKLGPQKQSSGTSMSTPTLGGTYSLLREFGFEPVAIVKALLESARKIEGRSEADGGKGFLDVYAAYQLLKKAKEGSPSEKIKGLIRPIVERAVRRLAASAGNNGVARRPAPAAPVSRKTQVVGSLVAGAAALAVPVAAAAFDWGAYGTASLAGHPVSSVALFAVGGAVVGFAVGAFIGWRYFGIRRNAPDLGSLVGLWILIDLFIALLTGLAGALVMGIAGAVLGAFLSTRV